MEITLYYGDNLDILRRYIKDESFDLLYLDPPLRQVSATFKKAPRHEEKGEQLEIPEK